MLEERKARYSRAGAAARRSSARHSMARVTRPCQHGASSRQTTCPPSAPRRALIGQRRARRAALASSDWAALVGGRGLQAAPAASSRGRAGSVRRAAAHARPGRQQWRPAPNPSWPTRAMASRSWTPTPPSWSWIRVRPRGLGAVAGLESGAGWGLCLVPHCPRPGGTCGNSCCLL